jgi:PST family polysaccharide transporter
LAAAQVQAETFSIQASWLRTKMPAGQQTVSLVDRTSKAAAWMSVQTVLTKFVVLATQLVLARLLLREDFGLYGLALTVYSFASMLHQAGIQEVLIKRQRAFRTWANAGFWLSLATGSTAAALTIAAAPWVARFYRLAEPGQLIAIISIMSLIFPIGAIGSVFRAKMQIDMRFRAFAFVDLLQIVLDAVLKIILAWLGFGAFSFAYASLTASVAYLLICWALAPVRIRWRPQMRRWRYLLGDGSLVVSAGVLYWLIEEGDYIVLGRFEDVGVVGLYFFAFKLSRHTMTLLTLQFSKVLFSALSCLPQDTGQQVRAFVRAARMIAVFAVPCCIALAAIADPLIRLLFQARWYDAIELIQILCLGMALRTISWPAASLLKAQGRFRTRMLLGVFSVLVFFPLAILGTWLGSARGLAVAVAGFYSSIALVDVGIAVWPSGRILTPLRQIFGMPLLASALATPPALAVAYVAIPALGLARVAEQVLQIVSIGLLAGSLYGVLIRWLSPDVWQDGQQRLASFLPSTVRRRFDGLLGSSSHT